jgi:hypothetical protein
MRHSVGHMSPEEEEWAFHEMEAAFSEGPCAKTASEVMPDGRRLGRRGRTRGRTQPDIIDTAKEQEGFRCNDKGVKLSRFCLLYILSDLLSDADLLALPEGCPLKAMGINFLDEITCMADGVCPLPHLWSRHKWHANAWNGQTLAGPNRPRNPASASRREGVFGYLCRIVGMWVSSMRHLRLGEEQCICALHSRRLPAPRAIRRDCRKSHATRSANSQSDDDDD